MYYYIYVKKSREQALEVKHPEEIKYHRSNSYNRVMLSIAITDRCFTVIKNKTNYGQIKCTNHLVHISQVFIKFTTYQAVF